MVCILNGGIFGNVGIFFNVNDIGIFVVVFFNGGEYNGYCIFSLLGVKIMCIVFCELIVFGCILGWDIFFFYVLNKGDFFSLNIFGYIGYIGIFIIIDLDNDMVVILLVNVVYLEDWYSIVCFCLLVVNVVVVFICFFV